MREITWEAICEYAINYFNENDEINFDINIEKYVVRNNWFFNDPSYNGMYKVELERKNISTDWLDLYERKWNITKGTKHTFELLMAADKVEEFIAIWIYAYLNENAENMNREQNKTSFKMIIAIGNYLRERFFLWHSSMKYLIPQKTFKESIDSSPEYLIECALNDTRLILNDYIIKFYAYVDENNELPKMEFDYYLRQ